LSSKIFLPFLPTMVSASHTAESLTAKRKKKSKKEVKGKKGTLTHKARKQTEARRIADTAPRKISETQIHKSRGKVAETTPP